MLGRMELVAGTPVVKTNVSAGVDLASGDDTLVATLTEDEELADAILQSRQLKPLTAAILTRTTASTVPTASAGGQVVQSASAGTTSVAPFFKAAVPRVPTSAKRELATASSAPGAVAQTPAKRSRRDGDAQSSPDVSFAAIMAELQEAKKDRAAMLNSMVQTGTVAADAMDRANVGVDKADVAQLGVDENRAAVVLLDDKLERSLRRSELVFRGIPIYGNEPISDLVSIAGALLTAVGFNADEMCVESVRVITNTDLLLVRFSTAALRAAFFRRYLALKDGLWATQLGFQDRDEGRIYAMDNLTPRNAAIRKKAVALMKAGTVSNVRVRDGLVSISLPADPDKTIPIISVDELDDLNALRPPVGRANHVGGVGRQRGRGGIWRGGRGRGIDRANDLVLTEPLAEQVQQHPSRPGPSWLDQAGEASRNRDLAHGRGGGNARGNQRGRGGNRARGSHRRNGGQGRGPRRGPGAGSMAQPAPNA